MVLNNGENGLFFSSETTFSFSALHVSTSSLDQLTRANYQHINDIHQTEDTYLHIDMKQMGVGGDNSWGARPHKPYRIPAQEYTFKFTIKPWKKGDDGFGLWNR